MAERITQQMIEHRIKILNDMLDAPHEYGEAGHYCLDVANGGVAVQRCDGWGADTIIPRGTTRQTYYALCAYMDGIKHERQRHQ